MYRFWRVSIANATRLTLCCHASSHGRKSSTWCSGALQHRTAMQHCTPMQRPRNSRLFLVVLLVQHERIRRNLPWCSRARVRACVRAPACVRMVSRVGAHARRRCVSEQAGRATVHVATGAHLADATACMCANATGTGGALHAQQRRRRGRARARTTAQTRPACQVSAATQTQPPVCQCDTRTRTRTHAAHARSHVRAASTHAHPRRDKRAQAGTHTWKQGWSARSSQRYF